MRAAEDGVAPDVGDIGEAPSRPRPELAVVDGASAHVESEVGASSPGDVTIIGSFFYRDDSDVLRPATWVTACAWDSDSISADDLLGCVLVDTSGNFSIGPVDNSDGLFGGGLDIYIEFRAGNSRVHVNDGSGNRYDAFTSTFNNVSDGTVNVGSWQVPTSETERGAWKIFSYHNGLNYAWRYLRSIATPGRDTPLIDVRYPFESGPHYHPGSEQMHIPDVDTANSPAVLLHEYGHHMFENYYAANPPNLCPSPHFITSAHNVQCAWTEGAPTYFGLAMLNDPNYFWRNNFNVNHETLNTGATGDAVEGRVSAAMWDAFDSTNDGFDTLTDGFNDQWKTFEEQDDTTYSQFYAAYRASRTAFSKRRIKAATFQNSIDYNSQPFVFAATPSTWQKGNVTLSATVVEADDEDDPGGLSVQFFRCLTGPASGCASVGTDTTPSGDCSNIAGCSFSRSWNSGSTVDPTVWVRATVTDGLEPRSDSSNSSFGVDNSDPVPFITNPLDGSSLDVSSFNATFGATDTGSGVLNTFSNLNGAPFSIIHFGGGPHSRSLTLVDGSHTLCVWASDLASNVSSQVCSSFTVDTAPPVLEVPPDITVEATSAAGAQVNYSPPAATDAIDPSPSVVCTPPPGSTFALGDTTVTCTATDEAGNSSSVSFTIAVQDTTPPDISVPGDVTIGTTVPAGAVFNYAATATDLVDPSPSLTCNPPSGSLFPVGDTTVTCEAEDDAGNTSAASFTVTVIHTCMGVPATIVGTPGDDNINGTAGNDVILALV